MKLQPFIIANLVCFLTAAFCVYNAIQALKNDVQGSKIICIFTIACAFIVWLFWFIKFIKNYSKKD